MPLDRDLFSEAHAALLPRVRKLVEDSRFADLYALKRFIEDERQERIHLFERQEELLRAVKKRAEDDEGKGPFSVESYQMGRDQAWERVKEQSGRLAAIDIALHAIYYDTPEKSKAVADWLGGINRIDRRLWALWQVFRRGYDGGIEGARDEAAALLRTINVDKIGGDAIRRDLEDLLRPGLMDGEHLQTSAAMRRVGELVRERGLDKHSLYG